MLCSICMPYLGFFMMAVSPAELSAASGVIAGSVQATPAKYLGDTVVYVVAAPGPFVAQITAMDQKGLQFVPRVVAVTAGDTVTFLNHDGVPHMVLSQGDEAYSLGPFAPGASSSHHFTKPGRYTQLCPLHPDMIAYIFVGQNPYHAVVDSLGRYEIAGVPPGTYQLAIWNAHLQAPPRPITVGAGQHVAVDMALRR